MARPRSRIQYHSAKTSPRWSPRILTESSSVWPRSGMPLDDGLHQQRQRDHIDQRAECGQDRGQQSSDPSLVAHRQTTRRRSPHREPTAASMPFRPTAESAAPVQFPAPATMARPTDRSRSRSATRTDDQHGAPRHPRVPPVLLKMLVFLSHVTRRITCSTTRMTTPSPSCQMAASCATCRTNPGH